MMHYHPYHDGKKINYDYDSQTLVYIKSSGVWNVIRNKHFHTRILTWFEQVIAIIESPMVIYIAPGPEANFNPSGSIMKLWVEYNHPKIAGKIAQQQ